LFTLLTSLHAGFKVILSSARQKYSVKKVNTLWPGKNMQVFHETKNYVKKKEIFSEILGNSKSIKI
jgi:hypothetical protein